MIPTPDSNPTKSIRRIGGSAHLITIDESCQFCAAHTQPQFVPLSNRGFTRHRDAPSGEHNLLAVCNLRGTPTHCFASHYGILLRYHAALPHLLIPLYLIHIGRFTRAAPKDPRTIRLQEQPVSVLVPAAGIRSTCRVRGITGSGSS